ncbi:hypothetical protein [Goodfellowiella coeruleoviolacea]|uniref:DUF5709 domain-containing protein n=1 Tax=Goodfellowiella coeruleoviolacea TaxID=334858 RepID=A0AAE3KH57_9PSEU|nr:hypothetical protein [Goodfellowiella coeruleoviolacea]MCP2166492.1 hypothetical protein [Goodfellowiella coeruleoviolacea]
MSTPGDLDRGWNDEVDREETTTTVVTDLGEETPAGDALDQHRPADPGEAVEQGELGGAGRRAAVPEMPIEANPADVVEQLRAVPEDEYERD